MICKTEAIVLKSMKFRDSSKIVTFYTRQYGKLKAVAKGARDTKSKFGASLEPMTRVELVIYRKDNRDLQLVTQSEILSLYKRVHSDLDRMAVAMTSLELVDKVMHDEEENARLYSVIVECLEVLEMTEGKTESILLAFELRLLALFGFRPAFDRCAHCSKHLAEMNQEALAQLQTETGSVLCPSCCEQERAASRFVNVKRRTEESHKARVETFVVLQKFLDLPLGEIPAIGYSLSVGNEMSETLRLYIRQHFEGLKPLKSIRVFESIISHESS